MTPARSSRRPLGSTYRLQLAGLGFSGATELVDYLHDLGVETLYVSPILTAAPGSTHGYDVVDPTRLDPALGSRAEFDALLQALDSHAMRLLVDIVPNHMATRPENSWWWDVLRRGEASEFSGIFDIDWTAQGGRVLVPTLAQPLSSVLDAGGAAISEGVGGLELEVDGERFPLRPGSARETGTVGSRQEMETLLARQHFRAAYWRLSGDEGNYRRFFDIDGLIGVRVEQPDVFQATHRLIWELATDDRIAGWRVDHVDGLADPTSYIARLRAQLDRQRSSPPVILIEKILADDETVRSGWEVDGTTGYEFANAAGGLFVAPAGAASIEQAGGRIAGDRRGFSALALSSKREVLDRSFRSPLDRLVRLVADAMSADLPGHDLSKAEMGQALRELTVQFDAYRTYLDEAPVARSDRVRLRRALARARPQLTADGRRALGFIGMGLMGEPFGNASAERAAIWLQVAQRWQQLSGAVTAKGVEDTATYRFCGLLGHAEVGSNPGRPAVAPGDFLAATGPRGRRFPSTLNATSTHDSKRSEDVRARLYALSEVPEEWNRLVRRWHRRHAPAVASAGGPDGHDELVAYQTFAALWPPGRADISPDVRRRISEYMVKEAREAKQRTEWTDPDGRYERALRSFIHRLGRSPHDRFGSEMERFVGRIGPAAATNSLALTVLKSVAPGVPDIYQGTELWDLSLTDPDNRRPVDFDVRRRLAGALPADDAPPPTRSATASSLLGSWADGRIKLYVLRCLLTLRRSHPTLFDRGTYALLRSRGEFGDHVVGLVRRSGPRWLIAVVPRLTLEQAGAGRFPIGNRAWGTTAIRLDTGAPARLTDVFTGTTIAPRRNSVDVGQVLATLPVSVLIA